MQSVCTTRRIDETFNLNAERRIILLFACCYHHARDLFKLQFLIYFYVFKTVSHPSSSSQNVVAKREHIFKHTCGYVKKEFLDSMKTTRANTPGIEVVDRSWFSLVNLFIYS